MPFSLEDSIQILSRTPEVLSSLLRDIPSHWSDQNEGGDTWSAFDVLGHLVYCDQNAWIQRIEIALSDNQIRRFEPLDRFAQIELNREKSINQLLEEFRVSRSTCLSELKRLNPGENQLSRTATHPDLGSVTLAQLIATWTAHDLVHLSQISRVMAKQYKDAVGPWIVNMKILNQ